MQLTMMSVIKREAMAVQSMVMSMIKREAMAVQSVVMSMIKREAMAVQSVVMSMIKREAMAVQFVVISMIKREAGAVQFVVMSDGRVKGLCSVLHVKFRSWYFSNHVALLRSKCDSNDSVEILSYCTGKLCPNHTRIFGRKYLAASDWIA